MYKTTVKIDGMISKMCSFHIEKAIKNVVKPLKIKTIYSLGTSVVYTEEPIDEESLTDSISKTGYTVKDIQTKEVQSTNSLVNFIKRFSK